MCTQKMRALFYIGAEKITFPPKPNIHTDRRTDISVNRVASLLKKKHIPPLLIFINLRFRQGLVPATFYREVPSFWNQYKSQLNVPSQPGYFGLYYPC